MATVETYSLDAAATKANQLRDPSFSSYLNASDHNSVQKFSPASTRPNSLSFSFNPQDLLNLHRYLGHKLPQEEEEIEVFEAEKYFNGATEDLTPISPNVNYTPPIPTPTYIKEPFFPKKEQEQEQEQKQEQEQDPVVEHTATPITHHAGTASISSTNSQSAFLGRSVHHHRRNSNRVRRRSFLLAALGCKCSCSDSGSVDVLDNDDVAPPATYSSKTRATTEVSSSWSGPVLNPWISEEMRKHETFRGFTVVQAHRSSPKEEIINPRKSLEVFGSPTFSGINMEKANPTTMEETMDTDSNASSDLFEIDSFTGKVDSYLSRQTSDATSDHCPTAPRYAPSEASIEWSVVTASAADFSVMSDFEEMNSLSSSRTNNMNLRRQADPKKIGKNNSTDHAHRKLSSGSFLGCKNQKAVEVAGDAFRAVSRRF